MDAEFGMVPLQANMVLTQNPYGQMQWASINIETKHANVFALSEWLQLSGLPLIEKGHASLSLKAKKIGSDTQGKATLTLRHMHTADHQTSSTPALSTLINQPRSTTIKIPFQGQGDWTTLLAQAALKQTANSAPSISTKTEVKRLGSIRIHQGKSLTQNERSRLRQMIKQAKFKPKFHMELTPDLGTAELTPHMRQQIHHTQLMIKSFMAPRGIKAQNIYLVMAQEKHSSTGSAGAIHINLVK